MKYECLFPIRKESSIFSLNLAFWRPWLLTVTGSLSETAGAAAAAEPCIVQYILVQQGVGAKTIPKEPNERKKKLPTHSFYIVHSEAIYSFRDNADAAARRRVNVARATARQDTTASTIIIVQCFQQYTTRVSFWLYARRMKNKGKLVSD